MFVTARSNVVSPCGEAHPVRVVERVRARRAPPASAASSANWSCARSIRAASGSAGASRRVSVRTAPPRRSSSSAIARPVYENAPVTTSIAALREHGRERGDQVARDQARLDRPTLRAPRARAPSRRRRRRSAARRPWRGTRRRSRSARRPCPRSRAPAASTDADERPFARRGDDRVGALEQADGSRTARRPRVAASSRCASTHAGLLAEQARRARPHAASAPRGAPQSPGSSSCSASASSTSGSSSCGEQLVAQAHRLLRCARDPGRSRARRPSPTAPSASAQVTFTGSSSRTSTTGSDGSGTATAT